MSGSYTCLLVLLALLAVAETLQKQETYITTQMNRRLDVTPRDVITHSSLIDCAVTCRLTSWCRSANLLSDRRTCQLLTELVSNDDDSLFSAVGWTYIYIRKYGGLPGPQNSALDLEE